MCSVDSVCWQCRVGAAAAPCAGWVGGEAGLWPGQLPHCQSSVLPLASPCLQASVLQTETDRVDQIFDTRPLDAAVCGEAPDLLVSWCHRTVGMSSYSWRVLGIAGWAGRCRTCCGAWRASTATMALRSAVHTQQTARLGARAAAPLTRLLACPTVPRCCNVLPRRPM